MHEARELRVATGWLGAARCWVGALGVLAVLHGPAALAQGFGRQGPGFGGPGQGGNPLLGAWTSQQPGGGGIVVSTVLYNPNGTYVITTHLPDDTLTRSWGQYRVQQVGPNQWQVDTQVTGYLPQQICIQVPSGARDCSQANFPMGSSSTLTSFNGPSVMLNNAGETWQRDPQPVLLQVQVPAVDVEMVAGPPPTMVAPPLTPGAGAYIRPYDSQPAQDFIHQRLKGCSPDPGTLHSYTLCDQFH